MTQNTVKVKVCACSHCMNTGASEIAQAIEDLTEIEGLLHEEQHINLVMERLVTENRHSEVCPLIEVEEQLFQKATSEKITTKILTILNEET